MNKILMLDITKACAIMLSPHAARPVAPRISTAFPRLLESPVAHLNTSNLAIHLPVFQPILKNATLQGTVSDFTKAAKAEKATNVDIVQSSVFAWWIVPPPLSFVLTPVSGNVAGNALP